MSFRNKLVSFSGLPEWRAGLQKARRLVVTNGCFDLLHLGHVTYLEAARALGDALLVGVNSDAAVRSLKGNDRPVNSENDRACVIAALQSVDAVCIFPESTATRFLSLARPDIYVKGGDYTIETLHPEERAAVEKSGAQVVLLPLVPGRSTSQILARMPSR